MVILTSTHNLSTEHLQEHRTTEILMCGQIAVVLIYHRMVTDRTTDQQVEETEYLHTGEHRTEVHLMVNLEDRIMENQQHLVEIKALVKEAHHTEVLDLMEEDLDTVVPHTEALDLALVEDHHTTATQKEEDPAVRKLGTP